MTECCAVIALTSDPIVRASAADCHTRAWSGSTGSSGRSPRTSTSSPTSARARRSPSTRRRRRLAWIADELAARDWTLKLIVSTHGHWDHIGDNAAVAEHTGADIAVHPLDRDRLTDPQPLCAPFEIPPSVPAVELAEGGEVRFGEIRLRVLHTPGHTEGSVCLLDARRAACCSAATRCSPAAGAASTCPAATPTRWSRRWPACSTLEDGSASSRATAPTRRSAASGRGSSSSATRAGCFA